MAHITGFNIHDCEKMTASAKVAGKTTWLTIKFNADSYPAFDVAIFMPLDRAQRIADAINTADQPAAVAEAAE